MSQAFPQALGRLAVALAVAAGLAGSSRPALPDTETAGRVRVSSYEWRLPAGFPEPAVPSDNPMSEEKVELGRHLFYDTRLSGNRTFSCASCHRPELAFTDGLARAVGATGEKHPRSSMSLANVAYNRTYNWGDPEKERLEEQMLVPMFGVAPVELGLAGREDEVLARFAADPTYLAMFELAFPEAEQPLTMNNLVKAIACFERTLVSGGSSYDRLVYWGDDSAFSAAARRGMTLFFSQRTHCGECHADFNLSGAIVFHDAPENEPDFHNTALYNLDGAGAYPERNRGIFEFTGEAADMGRFRPPTLRNIEVTAPYMHDGSVATLGEVIDHYAAGGRAGLDHPWKSELLTGFELSGSEKEDLIAFLRSLTDSGFLEDSRFASPFE